jgi:hypothetical protein
MLKTEIEEVASALKDEYPPRILREDAARHDAMLARQRFLDMTDEDRERVLAAMENKPSARG